MISSHWKFKLNSEESHACFKTFIGDRETEISKEKEKPCNSHRRHHHRYNHQNKEDVWRNFSHIILHGKILCMKTGIKIQKPQKNSRSETLRQKPTGKEAKQTLGTKHTHIHTNNWTNWFISVHPSYQQQQYIATRILRQTESCSPSIIPRSPCPWERRRQGWTDLHNRRLRLLQNRKSDRARSKEPHLITIELSNHPPIIILISST